MRELVDDYDVMKLAFVDISKAYFHAPARRHIYVHVPSESLKPEQIGKVCGRLNYSLYGTRDAATNREAHYTDIFLSAGFRQGVASTCIFRHEARNTRVVIHGDDITILASQSEIDWLVGLLSAQLKVKLRGVLGPGPKDDKQITILNRIVTWTRDSLTFEADNRHADIIVRTLLGESGNTVATPGTRDHASDENAYLDSADATKYRACAARCNFLAQDRPEIQCSVKEVCRGMANPTEDDLVQLKRIARYLKGAPRAGYAWPFQAPQGVLRVYSDSDWAGCERTRKSTQGGLVMYGKHCIKSYSSTQSTIALSSAEAEYYTLVKSASIALGMQAMYRDLGERMSITLHTDASAAKAIAMRKGLGKLRHVAVHLLWLQQKAANGSVLISQVSGKTNPAYLLTKYLSCDIMEQHMRPFNFAVMQGRAEVCPMP